MIAEYLSDVEKILHSLSAVTIGEIIKVIEEARETGHRVYLFGNGGSASTASHMAQGLSNGTLKLDKKPIRAIALTDNIPTITAWANDLSFETIFASQIETLVEKGDVVIAISGSGMSDNVLFGLAKARSMGATTIGLTGLASYQGNNMHLNSDILLTVPCSIMEQIEDIHLMVGHIITTYLRDY